VRLHEAIRVAIPSFVKLLTDDGEAVRSATLRVFQELAEESWLESDAIARELTQVFSRLSKGNWNNRSISHYTTGGLQRRRSVVCHFDNCQFS
jgi:hypothetical protein